tara:strand:- start:5454 stop:5975 length:522 start_codon:yes stop_codon:yes gene_type:complete
MKKPSLNLSSLIIIIFFLISSSYSNEKSIIEGKAVVVDGDTIKINNEIIRFGGIDAPESYYRGKKQFCIKDNNKVFCGNISKEKLKDKIRNNLLICKTELNKDRYKRLIGECFINDESLSVFMVKNGYAFDWPRYSKGKYIKEQEYAKENSLGFWSMKFEYPWIWRKKVRENK